MSITREEGIVGTSIDSGGIFSSFKLPDLVCLINQTFLEDDRTVLTGDVALMIFNLQRVFSATLRTALLIHAYLEG
jgi:hypothetical protein